MNEAPRYTSLRDYLRVLREQRVLIVAIAFLCAGVALALSLRAEPIYRASTLVKFNSETADFVYLGASSPILQSDQQRAAIAAQRIDEPDVAVRAARDLKTNVAPRALANKITARVQAQTNLVQISTELHNAERAAAVANAFGTATVALATESARDLYRDRANEIARINRRLSKRPINAYTRGANVDRIQRLRTLAEIATPAAIVRTAQVPADPISPQPIRNAILGLLAGLTLALLVAFGRDALDRRFRSAREITDELKLPLIGHIREESLGRSVVQANGRAQLTAEEFEPFRILRTNMEFLDVDKKVSALVVTSALPDEGKSTVSGALAWAYVAAGRRTLLVECDLRRPTLAKALGLQSTPGLSDYLAGLAGPTEVLQSIAVEVPGANGKGAHLERSGAGQLVCITAGTISPEPAELLGSERFKAFLAQVREAYDTVILDSSPLLSVVDTLELVPNVDGVVFCVRASRTTRDQARAAKAALDHFPDRPMGIVVTGGRAGSEYDYGYYSYAYGYGSKA